MVGFDRSVNDPSNDQGTALDENIAFGDTGQVKLPRFDDPRAQDNAVLAPITINVEKALLLDHGKIDTGTIATHAPVDDHAATGDGFSDSH